MPLTKVEQDICQFVVNRLLNEGEVTRRQALLKQFRGSLTDALRKLVDRAVLKAVEQVSGNETYLPRAIAFHYCHQPEAEEFARNSTETVMRVLTVMYERELDKEAQQQRQFSPSDVEAEAHNLELKLDSQLTRIGLYFADELSVFPSLQRDSNQVFLKSFQIGEHIYEVLKNSKPWDLLIERGRISVENYPYGRSLNSIDISEQPQNISDLPKKEKLIADVGSFLTRKAGIALLVIDLDHFKTVNDTKGHQEGDACLDRVVKEIGRVLGRKGILYRWGGDEFAISLPDFSTEEAHATAERIRSAVEQAKPGIDLPVTTSIGVSGSDQMTNASAEDLLEAADKAMYTSKQQGKNRVTSWSVEERLSKNHVQNESQIGIYNSQREQKLKPLVVPLRYGSSPIHAGKHSRGHHGLIVANHGEPAYDVSILTSEVQIGTSKLCFEGGKSTFTKADGDAFFAAIIERSPGSHIMGGALFDEMRKQRVDDITVALIYKDGENHWYKTIGKIERNVSEPGGLSVRYVRQEPSKQPS